MALIEFYVQTTGSNLNAGSTTSDTATSTYASGNWVAATGVFTLAGANLSTVSVGDWASVYADGSTQTGYVGRVTAVDDTADTITVSLTAKSGTAPADGTGNRTVKIGGAWKGPNGTAGFPVNFAAGTMTNPSNDTPRINIKAGTYTLTGATTADGVAGPRIFQGYTTTPGDLGMPVFDGGTSGASYTLFTFGSSGVQTVIADLKFQNNGATGSAQMVSFAPRHSEVVRCVFSKSRGYGLNASGNTQLIEECEFFECNQSNTANQSGLLTAGIGMTVSWCISHHNAGSNACGFTQSSSASFTVAYEHCIAYSNGAHGFLLLGTGGTAGHMQRLLNCDSYNNGGDGYRTTSTGTGNCVHMRNCNAVKNGGYGFNQTDVLTTGMITLRNCGFGTGTQANTSGNFSTITCQQFDNLGQINYPSNSTPWVDPANGDFRISLTEAKGAGRGFFMQTAAGYGGTVGYIDVGAAQHVDPATLAFSPLGGIIE